MRNSQGLSIDNHMSEVPNIDREGSMEYSPTPPISRMTIHRTINAFVENGDEKRPR